MTKFVSRRGVLGIAIESSRGTAVNPTYWLPWAVMSFKDEAMTAAEAEGLGNIADQDSLYVTMRMGNGSIDAQLYDKALGYILSSLLGAAPSSAGSNPYTHTYTLSQTNTPVTLSLYWKDPDRSLMFPMAVVDSLQITVEPSGLVEYTIGFKSKKGRDWTSQTADFTSLGSKFLHQHLRFKEAAAVGDLAAASETTLKRLDLTIARNSIFDETLGTSEVNDVLSKELSVTGSLTKNWIDDTIFDYAMGGTHRAMDITLYNSASSSLQFQFPRVAFSEWDRDLSLNEIAGETIQFKANYDAANALQIISTCVLINAKASY